MVTVLSDTITKRHRVDCVGTLHNTSIAYGFKIGLGIINVGIRDAIISNICMLLFALLIPQTYLAIRVMHSAQG
jgi:hypothetical protein